MPEAKQTADKAQLEAIFAAVIQSPAAPFEPVITDTWVDAQRPDVSIPDELR